LDGLQVQLAPVNNTDEEDIEVIGSQGPTASDGAIVSFQLTDTVSGFVSAHLSQTITKTIAPASYEAIIDVATSASATVSTSTSTAKNGGYNLEGMGLALLTMMLM
jgi:hypothetical protein